MYSDAHRRSAKIRVWSGSCDLRNGGERPLAQHTARAALLKATRRGLAQLVQAEPGLQRPPEPVDRLRDAALEVGSGRIVASEIA